MPGGVDQLQQSDGLISRFIHCDFQHRRSVRYRRYTAHTPDHIFHESESIGISVPAVQQAGPPGDMDASALPEGMAGQTREVGHFCVIAAFRRTVHVRRNQVQEFLNLRRIRGVHPFVANIQ